MKLERRIKQLRDRRRRLRRELSIVERTLKRIDPIGVQCEQVLTEWGKRIIIDDIRNAVMEEHARTLS